jgi:uncharacterized membrane protein YfcA
MNTKIRLSLLSLWLGVASLFSFVVAPAAFKALPNSWLAGNVVNRVLGVTEIIGMIVGVVLLFLLSVAKPPFRALWFQGVVLVLMTLSMALSKFVISTRLHSLREQYGEALFTMPLQGHSGPRFDFAFNHQLSVGLMSFNLLATLVLIFYLLRQPNSSSESHV